MGGVWGEDVFGKSCVCSYNRVNVQCLLLSLIVRGKNEFMYLSFRQCISLILSLLSHLFMYCGVNIIAAVSLWNKFDLNFSSGLSLACCLRVSNGSQPSPSISCVTHLCSLVAMFYETLSFPLYFFRLRFKSLCPGSQMVAAYSRCGQTEAN
jgi:hypothetical protein